MIIDIYMNISGKNVMFLNQASTFSPFFPFFLMKKKYLSFIKEKNMFSFTNLLKIANLFLNTLSLLEIQKERTLCFQQSNQFDCLNEVEYIKIINF